MKNLVCSIMFFVLSTNVIADCDFSAGISSGPNNTHIFTEDCYLKVGQLVQDVKVKEQQIIDYTKAIQLKDLAITNADSRTALWTKTAEDAQDRMNRLSTDQNRNDWIMFGLGALTVLGAGFMSAKLLGR